MAEPVPGTLQDYVYRIFGKYTTEKESFPLAGVTSGQVVEQNPRRLQLLIWNHGTSEVFISFFGAATLSNGVRIAPLGGVVRLIFTEDATLPGRAVQAISSVANQQLYVLEILTV